MFKDSDSDSSPFVRTRTRTRTRMQRTRTWTRTRTLRTRTRTRTRTWWTRLHHCLYGPNIVHRLPLPLSVIIYELSRRIGHITAFCQGSCRCLSITLVLCNLCESLYIAINDILLKTRFFVLHITFKVTVFGTNRKPICDFLLEINTNLHPILHHFPKLWLIIGLIFACDSQRPHFNALAGGDPL